MRCWARDQGKVAKDPTSYQAKILAKEPTIEANFASAGGVFSKARATGQARFVKNPENWGPRRKHGRPMMDHEIEARDTAASDIAGGEGAQGQNKRAKTD
jgi:tRNA (guanine26-N2/guanine27-N2)-dimethyltransferase